MLPLLLTAGRMLLAGAARGGAARAIGGGAGRMLLGGGAAGGARTAGALALRAPGSLIKIGKDKAKEKKKRISTKKLLAKTKDAGSKIKKGGGLILKKSSAIVKQTKGALSKTSDEKKGGGKGGALVKSSDIRGEILKELEEIKVDFIKVKEISTEKLLNQKQEDRQRYLEARKKKSEDQEKDLEKKDTKKKKKLGITAPKIGLFDMIKRFLLNVLVGSLINILLKNAPIIIGMFTDIGKNLSNVWQVLRLGIITLTTVFPRQVRTILSFTRKIIGPPARLIGRLLLKAGGVAGTLFKKAGGIIFNLIKGPLTSLVKKVGGEALEKGAKGFAKGVANRAGDLAKRGVGRLATRATLAVGGKSLVKRLATLSKIFKRVPIIGSLIGIGIDLALGEKLDRALAGAAGAALGAAIGGALGKGGALALTLSTGGIGVLAAPFIIGASGFLGSAIGDWAGKAIYDNLNKKVPAADKETPLEQRAFGGSINVRPSSVPTRTFSKSDSSVQRKTTTTTALSQQTLNKAKGTLLKDEESARRFANLSSAYGAIPFVGEAMKLGLDVSLGERVSKARTDAIAESIGSSIGMALKNDEFSVRGFNKRIIGEFSRNLTDWAKRKIFVSVKSQENQFKLLQEKKKGEERKATGDGTGQPGETDGGGVSTLDSAGSLKGLTDSDWNELAYIVSAEAASGDDEYGVAAAVLNRVASPAWPNTIKAVGRQQGQFEAVYTGKARYDKKLAEKLKNNQGKIAAALNKLNGRDSFKGQSMLAYKGPGDVMFQSNGNFFHYRQQQNKSDPAPQNPDQSWKKWISSAGGGNGIKHHKVPFLAMGGNHAVTSSMGMRNFALSPGMHMGVDIAGTRGEPLQAFTDGTVEAAGYDGGYGNWVNWIDNKGIGHFYGHMDKPAYVRGGQKIKKGTILGPLGNTGKSSGPHLHWEAATNPRDNGAPKSSVLSRFNPLSKYNKESPFGGSIQPDPSMATSSSDVASSQPGASQESSQPQFAKSFMEVIGDPAAKKGGGMGGGSGIDLWGISPSRNSKLGKNSGFGDVPAHHRSYTTEAGLPRDYAVVKSGVNPVANPSAGRGENVVAGVSGKVTFAGFAGGAGNHVVISSGGKQIIRLLHLDKILAKTGQSVNPSTVIGTQGNSGTRDIHVHVDGSQAVHTNWIKAMLGGQYQANPSAGESGESGGTSGSGAAPETPKIKLEFFEVIGDPAVNKSITEEVSQTPSYNKSGQSLVLMQGSGGNSTPPVRSKSRSAGSGGIEGLDSMVNSYGMVSRQIISSSLYKL